MEEAVAAATAPLRSKVIASSPTGQARSEVLVQQSMERLQVRPTTPNVVIHGLPTYQGVLPTEVHYAHPEPQETDDWTPGL